MGLTISARVLCDNCNITTVDLPDVDSPIPDGWMKDQGYANVMNGAQVSLMGYYCPTCVQQVGTKDLVKKTADISPDLTKPNP